MAKVIHTHTWLSWSTGGGDGSGGRGVGDTYHRRRRTVLVHNFNALVIRKTVLHYLSVWLFAGQCICCIIVTDMLERCSFVRCLMVDFSKAFDRVDHPILLAKPHNLDIQLYIPPQAINLIISYLTGRTQILKYDGHLSAVADITTSIVQGSGIGPILYVVMENDLCTLSSANILVKYADDTNLLVPYLTLTLTFVMSLLILNVGLITTE